MKHKTLFSLIVIASSYVYAQNEIKSGEYRLKKNSFKVSRSSSSEKFKSVVIEEKNNFFLRDINKVPRFDLPGDRLNSKDNIETSFVKVLGNDRIKEIPKGTRMMTNVYINPKGKVFAVRFINLADNVYLTLDEFDQLTSYIKEHVYFNVSDVVGPNSEYAFLTFFVSFDKLATNLQ